MLIILTDIAFSSDKFLGLSFLKIYSHSETQVIFEVSIDDPKNSISIESFLTDLDGDAIGSSCDINAVFITPKEIKFNDEEWVGDINGKENPNLLK